MEIELSSGEERREASRARTGFLGVGAIAAAIVTGLCADTSDAPEILLSPRNADAAAALAARFQSVRVCRSNQEVLDAAETVVLSMRPQDAEAALRPLRFRDGQIVISLLAGVSAASVAALVAPAREIVRAVPLPAVARRRGITPVHPPQPDALALFERLGGAVAVQDVAIFDALCAATATIAAQIDTLSTIADWLEAHGLEAREGQRYVAAMASGIDLSDAGRGTSFAALAADHATRGGINEQFLAGLRAAGVPDLVRRGLDAVLERIAES